MRAPQKRMHTPMTSHYATPSSSPLGVQHGYALNGDLVRLDADVVLPHDEQGQQWALQLWASEQGFEGMCLQGVKVAEYRLAPQTGPQQVQAYVPAFPPAGQHAYVMAQALVSWGQDGAITVHGLSPYPTQQVFLQPCMHGEIQCQWHADSLDVRVAEVSNPRSADNLSGSLVLEVWALDQAYQGGAWQGQQLASAPLGVLAGGNALRELYSQFAVPAPSAAQNICLMLREWTQDGYVTRDYRNIASPIMAPASEPAAAPEVVEAAPAPVVAESAASPAPEAAAPVEAEAAAEPEAAAPVEPQVAAEPEAAAPVELEAAAKPEAVAPVEQEAAAEAAPAPQAPAAEAVEAPKAVVTGVSVNRASAAELCAVKGVGPSLASAIIAKRPFTNLDALRKVKGMGPKLLDKIRAQLTL